LQQGVLCLVVSVEQLRNAFLLLSRVTRLICVLRKSSNTPLRFVLLGSLTRPIHLYKDLVTHAFHACLTKSLYRCVVLVLHEKKSSYQTAQGMYAKIDIAVEHIPCQPLGLN